MNKPPKITYLLGAGASYNALPIVNELPNVAECLLQNLESLIRKFNKRIGNEIPIFNKTKLLIEEVRKHHSIDTLARKIWIKNKNIRDSKSFDEEYARIKNLITAILYFKQINNYTKYNDFDICKDIMPNRKSGNQLLIDPRYEAFFAAIINEDCSIPENFNFISWNYDIQIEKTLHYYNSTMPIKDVANLYNINYQNFKLTSYNSQILKLNGTGLFDLNIPNVSSNKIIDHDDLTSEAFDIIIDGLSDDTEGLKPISTLIKFAWENESEISNHHAIAAKKIAESDFVVVIGYSFPIFNRQVDIDLFKDFSVEYNDKKIIIQAPEGDVNQYIEQLESIKSGLSKKATSITNLDQFYIPNEFWIQKPESLAGMAIFT